MGLKVNGELTWTMIYDEGFETKLLNGYKFFGFSQF